MQERAGSVASFAEGTAGEYQTQEDLDDHLPEDFQAQSCLEATQLS